MNENKTKARCMRINLQGFNAFKAGAAYFDNPLSCPYERALWSKGWSDAANGFNKPESHGN